jgi:hypothetical protein
VDPPAPVLLVDVGLDVVVEPALPEVVLDVGLVPPSELSTVVIVQAPVQRKSKAPQWEIRFRMFWLRGGRHAAATL